MRLEDLNWMDVERYLEQDDRIILVTGATEQHAYLSLFTDILIPAKIALAVAEREHVLVAPPFNFGHSRSFAYFPGTISLTRSTFDLVLVEMIECLLHQGFRRFLILNGHGGNHEPQRLRDFHRESDEVLVVWHDWWAGEAVKGFIERHGLDATFTHANWLENFRFCRVAEVPQGGKPFIDEEAAALLDYDPTQRQVIGDGSLGGLYQIDDTLMQELFALVVQETATVVRGMGRSDEL
jgi:creatinine amidohydrolase